MGDGSSNDFLPIPPEEESAGGDESGGLQLGLSMGSFRGGVGGGMDREMGLVVPEADLGREGDREGDRPELELGIGRSTYAGQNSSMTNVEEASAKLLLDFDRLSPKEQEFCMVSERANSSRDFQHKRPKVQFRSELSSCPFMSSSEFAMSCVHNDDDCSATYVISASGRSENTNLRGSMLNNGSSGISMESYGDDCGNGDECSISEIDDSLVKMDLTDDLLHMVFSFLNHIDLCQAAGVCRQWRAASAHDDFWRCLNFENRNISSIQFVDMCLRYPKATELNIFGAPANDLLAMEAMAYLRNMETLILGKGPLSDVFFPSIANCRMLKRLTINDASLGNGGGQDVTIFHNNLNHLEVIKCRVLRISIRCPLLKTLSLKRSTMTTASLNCTQLLELDIAACHKLSDGVIRAAATSCTSLTYLDMSSCSCVSDETLREIAFSCSNLRILNSSCCPNISLESVRLPMLTVLKLFNCEGITSASMAAISHSYLLEDLELDCCGFLTSVNLNLPHLQNISLVHCRKFVDLNLRCPTLSSITVSNCSALHGINIMSNCLQKLVLQKQESLIDVQLQCQQLQEVDLTECESLTNAVCKVFSDGGGCPMLRSLVLDNCESLTTVGFSSSSLISLSLVGCRSMISLELACPNLQQIYLDGCDHLERALFCPVGLQLLNLGICPKLSLLHIEAPYMSVLELKGCGVLAEASIVCPLLSSLDASFCSQLKDDCLSATTSSCPLIEGLILMSCPSIGYSGLSSLRWLPNLLLLDLSYTFLMNLQPVFESCLQLKVLKLQACKYLADSSLDALYKEGALPALRELDLSYGTICQSAIEELLACCTHLTHVSLNGCINMHDLNWGSRTCRLPELSSNNGSYDPLCFSSDVELMEQPNRLLQNLNCVGCPNIKKVVIPHLARCFHLSYLNLSLSGNLKEVDLDCFNLNFLNLSNCSSLEMLRLKCPRLSSLLLQSCSIEEEAVEAAISHCCMLETLDIRFCAKIYVTGMGRFRVACPSLKRIFTSLVS